MVLLGRNTGLKSIFPARTLLVMHKLRMKECDTSERASAEYGMSDICRKLSLVVVCTLPIDDLSRGELAAPESCQEDLL